MCLQIWILESVAALSESKDYAALIMISVPLIFYFIPSMFQKIYRIEICAFYALFVSLPERNVFPLQRLYTNIFLNKFLVNMTRLSTVYCTEYEVQIT